VPGQPSPVLQFNKAEKGAEQAQFRASFFETIVGAVGKDPSWEAWTAVGTPLMITKEGKASEMRQAAPRRQKEQGFNPV